MFKGHPKGLMIAFFANMGERFGFYTMMACLVFFLQARYNLSADGAGEYYSWFYFAIYALALFGGFLADKTKKYKSVIMAGIVLMFVGYIIMAIPGLTLYATVGGLFVIAFGNGLFKGNLQALVGQMYDDPQYSHLRDRAYSWFYMGINVGALFAPHAANGIRNWFLKSQGFIYDQDLATQSNRILAGESVDTEAFTQLATAASTSPIGDNIQAFAQRYIDVFSQGYNYAFGVAAISMVISLVVYIFWKKMLPDGSTGKVAADAQKLAQADAPQKPLAIFWALGIGVAAALGIYYGMAALGEDGFSLAFAAGLFIIFVAWILQIATKEEKPRISALLLVFVVVIFFWMAFHQNGLTMTLFARDYTTKTVSEFSMIFFNVWSLLAFGVALTGLGYALKGSSSSKQKMFGGIAAVAGGAIVYYFYTTFDTSNRIQPEIFQHFNPFYIVFLTPLVIGFFAWLNKRGKEPSTPRKIGIGMILAAVAFTLLLLGSLNLVAPREFNLTGATIADDARISHWWLISTYFIITIAELFLSPMGLSFVSKVSPVRFQGLMQGGWLAATAVGNKLLFVGSKMWDKIDLWQLWLIFIVFCVLSAAFIFSIMKKLEKATK